MSNQSDSKPRYPGIPVTVNGNYLVAKCVETRITEGGIFYPITPSTEGGELYQEAFAMGELDVWGNSKIAIECEGEHAAQGGATAFAVTGKRAVNFTSGQGIAYAMEQYYHAPGKLSTMVVEVGARALTKQARASEAVLRIARTQHPKEAARAQKVAVERRKTAELKTAAQGGALPADAQRTVKVAAEEARG